MDKSLPFTLILVAPATGLGEDLVSARTKRISRKTATNGYVVLAIVGKCIRPAPEASVLGESPVAPDAECLVQRLPDDPNILLTK